MIRFFPLDIYEIGAVESYLYDMAGEGYILTELGFFAHYKKGEPTKITYRMEPITKDEDGPDSFILESYGQLGWHYICTASNKFYIFASYDGNPVELHTEPVVQSCSFEYLAKKWRVSNIGMIVVLAVVFSVVIWEFMTNRINVRRYVEDYDVLWNLILVFIMLYGIIVWVRQNKRIKNTINNLKCGVPIEHKTEYKKRYENTILTSAIVLIYLVRIIVIFYGANASWDKSVENYVGALPTIMLDEIENGTAAVINDNFSYNGVDYSNFVNHEWSEIAPDKLYISQSYPIKGKMWADGSGEYEPSINTNYFELRFKFLSDDLVKDLIEYESEFLLYDHATGEELADTGFDYAYFMKSDEEQILFAYKDNKVIKIKYYGYGNLKEHIDVIEERVANF